MPRDVIASLTDTIQRVYGTATETARPLRSPWAARRGSTIGSRRRAALRLRPCRDRVDHARLRTPTPATGAAAGMRTLRLVLLPAVAGSGFRRCDDAPRLLPSGHVQASASRVATARAELFASGCAGSSASTQRQVQLGVSTGAGFDHLLGVRRSRHVQPRGGPRERRRRNDGGTRPRPTTERCARPPATAG